jgi:hypothetical protein
MKFNKFVMAMVVLGMGACSSDIKDAKVNQQIDVSQGGAGSYAGPYPSAPCDVDSSHYAIRGPFTAFGQTYWTYFWRSSTGGRVIGRTYWTGTGAWEYYCYDYSPFDRIDPMTGVPHVLDLDKPRNVNGIGSNVLITADYGRYSWFTHDAYTWLQTQ